MSRLLAALAGAALAVVCAVPAQAAPGPGVDFRLQEVTIGPGGLQFATEMFTATAPVAVTGASIALELTGDLDGVLLAGDGHPGGPCGQVLDKKLSCSLDDMSLKPGAAGAAIRYSGAVSADDTAVPGHTGTLTATFTADHIAPITRSVRVRVGAPVDLATDPGTDVSARPGAAFPLPLTVRATGTTAATGTAVVLHAPAAYESAVQFSNCRYQGAQLSACSFDQTLEPGVSYRAAVPMRLRRDTFAPYSWYASATWQTADEFADLDAFLTVGGHHGLGEPGAGGVLRLVPLPAAKAAAPPQADPHETDNVSSITLKSLGSNGLNLVAVGARVTGRAGSTVVAEVGVRNAGPATLDLANSNRTLLLTVAVPPGSTAASVPPECAPLIDGQLDLNAHGGELGHTEYWCLLGDKLAVGQTESVPFGLRITKVIASATGAIEINKAGSDLNQILFTGDAPKTDNKSAIVLNAPGQTGGGGSDNGGTGGNDGDNGNGDGTDGGGLPITGPRSLALGGSGLLLLLAGAGAFLLVRRRRTRFEA